MKALIVSVLLFSIVLHSSAQEGFTALKDQEDSLRICLDSLRKSPRDFHRKIWNKRLRNLMDETLDMKGAFEYPFDSLKTMAKLTSPDKVFRIFNWNIENDNGTYTYYAFVLVPKNKTRVFELIDASEGMTDPENKSLDHKKWYGALYYAIILSGESGRNEYTLLGWDGNNRTTAKKLIDVMIISNDKIQFGAPIFTGEDKKVTKRVIFEYSSKASMSLRYDAKDKFLEFDHLSPETEAAEGIREFYFPDGSFDAFLLENEKWIFIPDADARRGRDRRDRNFTPPR